MSDTGPTTDRPPDRPPSSPGDEPSFGPGGYLPDRAARRARKIILRAPLGLQWIIASVVAGIVVVVAGVVFLMQADDPPGPPFERVGELSELSVTEQLPGSDVLIVTAGGRVRAFSGAGDLGVQYCEPSRRLESGDAVWTLTGRGLGGASSLEEHPTVVHDGVLYLDPTRTVPGPPASDEPADPACAGG